MATAGRQHGYTLLLILLVLLVGGASIFVTSREPGAAARSTEDAIAVSRLEAARDAVIAYALSGGTANVPGALPCIDNDMPGDGVANPACTTGGTVYTGWLPWRTMDLSQASRSFWYVIDSDFRDNAGVEPLNVSDIGSLQLDGQSGFAALIIDPGEPLAGQASRGGASATLGDYLDGENADGDLAFENCSDNPTCNDRVVGISADRLLQLVQRRAVAKIGEVLQDFYDDNGHFPYAAGFSGALSCNPGSLRGRVPMYDGTCGAGESLSNARFTAAGADWVTANDWEEYVVYAVDSDCTMGSACSAPGLTLKSGTGLAVLLAGPGTELPSLGQNRSASPNIDDYLESPENTDGDDAFDDAPLSENVDNDVLSGFMKP